MRALLLLACSCGRIAFDPVGGDGTSDANDGNDATSGVLPRIRSVYRNTHAMTASPLPVTIAAVDPTKAFVLCEYRTTDSAAGRKPMCVLTDATTVTLSAGVPDPAVVVAVQVIEFTEGARVQRGITSMTPMTEVMRDVPIAPVQLDRAFVVVSRWTDNPFNNADPQVTVMAELVSPTMLRLSRRMAGTALLDVAWQVIELDGVSVQAGRSAISVDAASVLTPLPTPVTTTDTFVVTSHDAPSDIEGVYLVHTSCVGDQLAHVRSLVSTEITNIAWFAITVPDGDVQHGVTTMDNAAFVNYPTSGYDANRTFSVLTTSGGTGVNNDLDNAAVTGLLTGTPFFALERGMPDVANVHVSWFVVEWPL